MGLIKGALKKTDAKKIFQALGASGKVVHVRTWIEQSQGPIDLEGIHLRSARHGHAEHQLEHLAIADVDRYCVHCIEGSGPRSKEDPLAILLAANVDSGKNVRVCDLDFDLATPLAHLRYIGSQL